MKHKKLICFLIFFLFVGVFIFSRFSYVKCSDNSFYLCNKSNMVIKNVSISNEEKESDDYEESELLIEPHDDALLVFDDLDTHSNGYKLSITLSSGEVLTYNSLNISEVSKVTVQPDLKLLYQ